MLLHERLDNAPYNCIVLSHLRQQRRWLAHPILAVFYWMHKYVAKFRNAKCEILWSVIKNEWGEISYMSENFSRGWLWQSALPMVITLLMKLEVNVEKIFVKRILGDASSVYIC